MKIMEKKFVLFDQWIAELNTLHDKNVTEIFDLRNELNKKEENFWTQNIFKKIFAFKKYMQEIKQNKLQLDHLYAIYQNINQDINIVSSFYIYIVYFRKLISDGNFQVDKVLVEEQFLKIQAFDKMIRDFSEQMLIEKKVDFSDENLNLLILSRLTLPKIQRAILNLTDCLQNQGKAVALERKNDFSDYLNDKNISSAEEYKICLSFKTPADILFCAFNKNWDYETYKKMSQLFYDINQMSLIVQKVLADQAPDSSILLNQEETVFNAVEFLSESDLIKQKKDLLKRVRLHSVNKEDDMKKKSIQGVLDIDLELKRRAQV